MKRILLAVMLSIGALGFTQSVEEVVKEQIVNKIKGYKLTDLVPYSKDGKKWALIDVKSRKILTDFVMRSPSTFNPEFYVYIDINGLQEEMEISSDYTTSPIIETPPPPIRKEIIEKTNKLGFKVDENGKTSIDLTNLLALIQIHSKSATEANEVKFQKNQ